jgi:3-phenylpropionate/trans-cinnamate dioxygenase ferredoxin reductase subunit
MGGESEKIIVLGAGHAGGSAVAFLRQFGWAGGITLIGDEPVPPYHRPPLSKAWLKGEADAASLVLRPESFYADNAIELRLGSPAAAINRAAKTVALASGEILPYDRLILALGARARKLAIPGAGLDGVLELRNAADADRLKAALGPGKVLAVVGGGYIGLEAAASARALGAEVTILEREPRLLARVASAGLSNFFQRFHRDRGVRLELNAGVERLEGQGRIAAVRLSDGRAVQCDAALIGVGAVANDDLARAAGLACAGGIEVDLAARTADPAIYAIGDCSFRPLPQYGRNFRLESVPNAVEQARQAAASICARPPPVPEVPWFWSDQYELRLQIAGLAFDVTETVLRGDPAGGSFAFFHLAPDASVQAVEAINAPPEFMAGKLLIARRKPVSREMLADVSVSMKDLL